MMTVFFGISTVSVPNFRGCGLEPVDLAIATAV